MDGNLGWVDAFFVGWTRFVLGGRVFVLCTPKFKVIFLWDGGIFKGCGSSLEGFRGLE